MQNSPTDIRKYSFFLLLTLIIAAQAWVNPEYIETRFDNALTSYRSGDYTTAHLGFTDLLMDSRGSRFYAMTYYLLAMSSYKAANWEVSTREFGDFAQKFPENPAAPTAWVYRGNAFYKSGDLVNATKSYLYALDSPSSDPATMAVARKSARALLWGYLAKDQLLVISDCTEGPSSQLVDYIRAKRHAYSGESAKALDIATRSLNRRPTGDFADSLRNLSNSISKSLSDNLVIAAFAPTSGAYTEYGQNMLNGIELAIAQYEKSSHKKIEIVVENTGADILVGAYAARNVLGSHSPVAAVGPLTSDVAVSIGAFCDQYRVPMVSPTASKDGLAGISPYVFQIATPPSIGAEKLAEYALNNLYIYRFAALAPDDPVGRKAVAYFAAKAEELGGEVVSVAYYAEGTVDFSEHFAHIRKPFYEQMQRQVARAETTDTRFYKPDGTMRDEEKWIIEIPGLFIPAYFEDLVNILPQVPFNYIRTRLLGANGWIIDDVKTLDASYIDSAVVVADNFWVDHEAPGWGNFVREYRKAFDSEPDRIAALGYDAAKLICRGFENDAITQDQMRDYLAGVADYSGPSGIISFDASGTNIKANLVIFDKRTPKLIEK